MRKLLVGLLSAMASLGMVACGGGTATPHPTLTTSTPENTLACHDFGRLVVQATQSSSKAGFEQALSELLSATDPTLRRSGNDLREAISGNKPNEARTSLIGIAERCRKLGLIDKDGDPT